MSASATWRARFSSTGPDYLTLSSCSIYDWHVIEAFELGTDGPKVILVGVDDSVTALRAGAYAAGLARRQGARLVCVYVEQLSSMTGAAAAGAGAMAAQGEAVAETAADMRRR